MQKAKKLIKIAPDMEENQVTFSHQENLQKAESGSSKFIWLLIVVVLIGLVAGGVFFFRSRQKGEEISILIPTPTYSPSPTLTPTLTPELTPTPTSTSAPTKSTPTPTKKPTPTPTSVRAATSAAELKRQAISVQVLNGSGVAGAAKKIADYLAGLSYTISNTGNADNYDYEKIVIETKKTADLDLLKADLGAQYAMGTASATLSASSSYDAVVTVGKQ